MTQFIFFILLVFSFSAFAEDALKLGKQFELEKKYGAAEKQYRKALFQGNGKGGLYIYDLHQDGHISVKNADNIKKIGLRILQNNADNGDGNAALSIGDFYLYGQYLKGDYQLAHHYFVIADKAGKPMASYRLGMSYLDGLYNNINANKAMFYLKKASDAGIASASRQIAIAYHLGIGKSKNINKAIEYYTKAANGGDKLAIRDLANIYNHNIKDKALHENN